MNLKKATLGMLASSLALSSMFSLHAQVSSDSLEQALMEGKVSVDFRLRAEIVDEDTKDATAITERLRLGYTTAPFYYVLGHIDIEDVRALSDSYNAAGLNGKPNKSVVADPEDTEVNQAYLQFKNDYVTAKLGRQRIVLDDARFIGDVGWRQNQQTYDSILFTGTPIEKLALTAGYITEVNRIFGPDAGLDFESESVILNGKYSGIDFINITAFAYLLDFDNSAANSSDTFGVRFDGGIPFSDNYKFDYELSYANQTDAGKNTTDYSADYIMIKGSVGRDGFTIGAGYELLGSDGGRASFRTPLATGHKYNGWADKFLTTPAAGLEDTFFFAKAPLPLGVKLYTCYHMFEADAGGADFGDEIDVVFTKKLSDNWSLTAKFADFNADSTLTDVTKYSFQTDYKF
jgi:hypothetical protein